MSCAFENPLRLIDKAERVIYNKTKIMNAYCIPPYWEENAVTPNILLLCPSLYRENLPMRRYCSNAYAPGFEVAASHTNIPVCSVLMKYLHEHGEQIDRVIMLASHECHELKNTEFGELTTLEYIQMAYDGFAQSIYSGKARPIEYSIITVDMRQIEDTAQIQGAVDGQLASLNVTSAQIWVDFTSGPRSYAILLVFLMRYFETQRGYSISDILYANISTNQDVNTIDSCYAVYRMFNTYRMLEDVSRPFHTQDLLKESRKAPRTADEMTLDTLHGLSKSLESDLRNAAGDRSAQIRHTREQVVKIRQETENPTVISLADAIMSGLPSTIDMLSQVEYLLDHDEVSAALTRLRETAFSYLVSEGVIVFRRPGRPDHVETELVTARFYYESFIGFMLELLGELENDKTLDPAKRLSEKIEGTLERRYDEKEFENYRARPTMNDSLRAIYQRVCGAAVRRLDDAFLLSVRKILESSGQSSAGALLQEMRAYQRKLDSFEQIFLQTGFPMVCTDYRTRSYYYEFYREDLTERATSLMQLLRAIWKGESGSQTANLMSKLPQGSGYTEALEYCKKNIQRIIKLRYSCVRNGNSWYYGGGNIDCFQKLLNDYLPVHNQIRKLRNSYVHALRNADSLSIEENAKLSRQSIGILRNIVRQKNT